MSAGDRDARRTPGFDVRDLLGARAEAALERFGQPVADRRAGRDRWLVFEGPGGSLRLRARPRRPGASARIRSWTATFRHGFDTLADALRALGLEEPAPPPGVLRLPLRDAAGRVHSLTASTRDGRVRSVSGFDEPPEWDTPPMTGG